MIIFVGSQGVGKTTQARLLWKKLKSTGCDAHITSLIHYTIFHLKFISLLSRLCRKNAIIIKFYEDLPPQASPSPEIYRKVFGLLVILHFIGFVLSVIKQKLLMLFYDVLIEHEGYVFKQLADLYYLARVVNVDSNSVAGKLLKFLTAFLLGSLIMIKYRIIYLQADYSSLKTRYLKRRTHIEPLDYISFQNKIYNMLILGLNSLISGIVIKLDADRSIGKVHLDVISHVV